MSANLQNSYSNHSDTSSCGDIITFRAIHSYKGNASKCQLSFQKGDIIVCNAAHVSENDRASGGWLWGSIENSGCGPSSPAVGWFPPKFVQRLSSSGISIAPPVAAAAEVDDPFAGLPLLNSTSAGTNTCAPIETVEEEITQEEKSITSPDVSEMKHESINPDPNEAHSFQLLTQYIDEPTGADEQDHDEFGDFDGGIQPENTIEHLEIKENASVSDEIVTTKGVLELPSPETLVAFVVNTKVIEDAGQKDPPTLPFSGDTAAVAADSDQDTYDTVVHLSDAWNVATPTEESDIIIDGNFANTTTSDPSNFDKNTTLKDSGKKSALELPSPEKLGILINRLDIESFDKGIIPDIPYLDDDEPPVDEPINSLTVDATYLPNDETTETDTTGKPSLSAKSHKFMRIDSSISKLESFHSVRESIGTAAEESSQDKNDNEQGKMEDGNPTFTSPPGQFFDAIEDEEELNGVGKINELHFDNEKSCISDSNSNQIDSKSVEEGQQYDEDEFGDFNGNVSPAKQQLSVAASDDFGSFDGGFFSSPTSGHLNDGISVSNGDKSCDFPAVLDGISIPPLSEYRSSDLGDDNHDGSSISLTNNSKPDPKDIVDNDISAKNGGGRPDVKSATLAGIFVSSEAPSWQQEQGEDILCYESVNEKVSSKSSNEIDDKDAASQLMLNVPFSSEALEMKQNHSILSVNREKGDEEIGGRVSSDNSIEKLNGEDAYDSSSAPLGLPSPAEHRYSMETTNTSKHVSEEDSGADIVEGFPSAFRQNPDSIKGDEDFKGRTFGFFIDGDKKAENSDECEKSEHSQIIDKISISNAFELPSPDKLGIYVEATGAQLVNSLHLPFSQVPDGSLGDTELKFDEVPSANDANGDIINNSENERVDDADSVGGSNSNQACNFQSPEELELFIETTAARLKDTLSENVSLSQTDVGQKLDLDEKSLSGNDSDDGFGEFSDGLALASTDIEYDSTNVLPSTFNSGDVSELPLHVFNHHDNISIERFQGPSSSDAVEGWCMKKAEEQPEEFGDFLENVSDLKLHNGDIHPVGASTAHSANEGKPDFLSSMTSIATEFAAFPETSPWIDDANTNNVDTSPNDACIPPKFQSVTEVQTHELPEDLKLNSLESLESSAEIQVHSNQRLDEETQEFDEFGDFGSATFQQLQTDSCLVQPEMDDLEFGDFADFDEPKQDMPQSETIVHTSPDTKSNFDESDFGDFTGDFTQTQEIPGGDALSKEDHEWIMAAQEVMESIFPMPNCTFSYPTGDYRPPSIADVLVSLRR